MLALLFCFTCCFLPSDTSDVTTHVAPLEDCENVRVVECVADISNGDVVGIKLYNTSMKKETLVSYDMHSKECVTTATLASCTISNVTSTLTAKVVVTDLNKEETRKYTCEVRHFHTKLWTETYNVNATVKSKGNTTASTRPAETKKGVRMVPVNSCDTVRTVECTADTSSDDFVSLIMLDMNNEDIVSIFIRSRKCKTAKQPAACVFNEENRAVVLKAFLTDLERGETRRYRCDANYFDRIAWTEQFYFNVSVPTRETNVNSTTSVNSTTITFVNTDPEKLQTIEVISLAIGVIVTFVFMICMCLRQRGRPTRCTGSDRPQEHSDQALPDRSPEMVVNNQLAAGNSEAAMANENSVGDRVGLLPGRSTAAERCREDSEDTAAQQPAARELPDIPQAFDAASDEQAEGPYADIKEEVVLLTQEIYTESANRRHLTMQPQKQKMTFEEQAEGPYADIKEEIVLLKQDFELGATTPGYVPLRDIAERKRRGADGIAKRATVICF